MDIAEPGKAKHQYPALDSLRGIAALGVIITHFLQHGFADLTLNHTPFRLFVNGRSFVIFFFVLSGFVLATALWHSRKSAQSGLDGWMNYAVYAVRRFVRLYPPYAAAGLLAAALFWTLGSDKSISIADYFLMLGTDVGMALNDPSWSLVYEMRISLLMPFICALILWSPRIGVIMALGLFAFEEIAVVKAGIGQYPYGENTVAHSLIVTLRFTVCFFLGAFLAYESQLRARFFEICARHSIVSFAIAFVCMSLLYDQSSMIGAAIIIALALRCNWLKSVLALKPFVWLGKISYSLYLTHMIIITYAFPYLLQHGNKAALFLVLPGTLIVGALFYSLVEKPSIDLSRRISARMKLPQTHGLVGSSAR